MHVAITFSTLKIAWLYSQLLDINCRLGMSLRSRKLASRIWIHSYMIIVLIPCKCKNGIHNIHPEDMSRHGFRTNRTKDTLTQHLVSFFHSLVFSHQPRPRHENFGHGLPPQEAWPLGVMFSISRLGSVEPSKCSSLTCLTHWWHLMASDDHFLHLQLLWFASHRTFFDPLEVKAVRLWRAKSKQVVTALQPFSAGPAFSAPTKRRCLWEGRNRAVVGKSLLRSSCCNSFCMRKKKQSMDLPRDTMLQTIGPISFVSQTMFMGGNHNDMQ